MRDLSLTSCDRIFGCVSNHINATAWHRVHPAPLFFFFILLLLLSLSLLLVFVCSSPCAHLHAAFHTCLKWRWKKAMFHLSLRSLIYSFFIFLCLIKSTSLSMELVACTYFFWIMNRSSTHHLHHVQHILAVKNCSHLLHSPHLSVCFIYSSPFSHKLILVLLLLWHHPSEALISRSTCTLLLCM